MKIGNFGTGRSRTYISRGKPNQSQQQHKEEQQKNATICVLIIGIISVLIMGYWEYGYMQQLSSIHSLTKEAQTMPYGDQGVDYLVDYNQDNKIVHLQNVDLRTQDINDQEFGFQFQGLLSSKRQMEYCQWQEHQHSHKKAIGYDSSTNSTIYETTYTYTYHLGWHSHPINSLFFDSAVSYHNPQRNPIQSQNQFTQALVGQKIQFNTFDISNSPLMDYQQYYIPHDANVGDIAYYNGFTITTEGGKWAYSKYQEDYSYLKSAASLILEGVIDLGIKGTCTPGDIRATWLNAQNPGNVSIIGLYKNNVLQPVSVNNSIKYLLAVEGSKDLGQIDYIYTNMIKSDRAYYRYIFLALSVILFIIFLACDGMKNLKSFSQSQPQSQQQQQQQKEKQQKQEQQKKQQQQGQDEAQQAKEYYRNQNQQQQQQNYDNNDNVNYNYPDLSDSQLNQNQQQFIPGNPMQDNPPVNPLNQHQKRD